MRVKKAVIPAAGYGTRMLPITKAQPKEVVYDELGRSFIHYENLIKLIFIFQKRGGFAWNKGRRQSIFQLRGNMTVEIGDPIDLALHGKKFAKLSAEEVERISSKKQSMYEGSA